MNHLLPLLLTGATPADSPTGGSPWPLLIGIVAIFYFLLLRPQMKEQKRRREMLSTLKKNDRVVTNGGMIGVISAISDDEVTLKVDDSQNVRIRFTRSAIAGPAPVRNKEAPEKDSG